MFLQHFDRNINFAQQFFHVQNIDLDAYRPVIKRAYRLKKENEARGWRTAITGHSLGGGIANIAGSAVRIKSIAFSPPGMVLSKGKFEYKTEKKECAINNFFTSVPCRHNADCVNRGELCKRLNDFRDRAFFPVARERCKSGKCCARKAWTRQTCETDGDCRVEEVCDQRVVVPTLDSIVAHVVSFIPTVDVVPQVDAHAGTVQHTLCSRQNPLQCHMIGAMVCDLLQRCGDGRTSGTARGARFDNCQYEEKMPSIWTGCKDMATKMQTDVESWWAQVTWWQIAKFAAALIVLFLLGGEKEVEEPEEINPSWRWYNTLTWKFFGGLWLAVLVFVAVAGGAPWLQ